MELDIKLIDENGKRLDGRSAEELRKIKIEAGVLHRADGSCYLEWGSNKVLAAVYGPREAIPRHTQNPLRAIVNARYNMCASGKRTVGLLRWPGTPPDRFSFQFFLRGGTCHVSTYTDRGDCALGSSRLACRPCSGGPPRRCGRKENQRGLEYEDRARIHPSPARGHRELSEGLS